MLNAALHEHTSQYVHTRKARHSNAPRDCLGAAATVAVATDRLRRLCRAAAIRVLRRHPLLLINHLLQLLGRAHHLLQRVLVDLDTRDRLQDGGEERLKITARSVGHLAIAPPARGSPLWGVQGSRLLVRATCAAQHSRALHVQL
eukprot:3976970-Prymnesium_polylepis.2